MATEYPEDGEPHYTCTHAELMSLVFEAAGAATGLLMRDHPNYVFPSEEVSERVAEVIREKTGIEPSGVEGYAGIKPADDLDRLRRDIHNRNQEGQQNG